jgi:hypothetical protein
MKIQFLYSENSTIDIIFELFFVLECNKLKQNSDFIPDFRMKLQYAGAPFVYY